MPVRLRKARELYNDKCKKVKTVTPESSHTEGENSICEHNHRNRALGALVLPQALLWPAVIGEVREQNVTTTGTPSRSPSTTSCP